MTVRCDTKSYDVVVDCLAARYSRLDATGWETEAWKPSIQNDQQWIQVDFSEPRVVSAISLKGRDPVTTPAIMYVTSFKVLVSMDCSNWTPITDQTGSPEVFVGTSGADVTVTRYFAERVFARCVRVNPVTWQNSLRFDVLGCAF